MTFWNIATITILLTLSLMIFHYLAPYLRKISWLDPSRITSFAGGVAVGYVFLHMLPEMVESHDKIHELLSRSTVMSQFRDLLVFVVALVGFDIFYMVERFASSVDASSEVLHKRSYNLHLVMYFIYNFLITYTMILRVESGITYAVLFTLAMGIHFTLTDSHMKRYFPDLFNVKSHILLLIGLAFGCIVALIEYPINVYITAMLTAFLSGAVLYNSFSEEIPMDRKASTPFFILGSIVMGTLLAFDLIH